MILKIEKPFDDEYLKYDEINEMYELNISICKTLVGNVYRDDEEMTRRIKLNSLIVYNFIYNHGNTSNKRYTKFILNNTKQGRKFIYKCLQSQIMADAKSGYNDLGSENLVDLATGSVIDRQKIKDNLISVNTEEIIANSKADLCGYSVTNPFSYGFISDLEKEINDD